MANSQAMSTTNQFVKYQIRATQNSQSIANNTSNVTVQVYFYRTNTGYTTYGNGTVWCKINGTTYSAGISSGQGITNSGITLFNTTLSIPHNADGTKTLTMSAWFNIPDVVSGNEQSWSMGLTTIPRASSMSVANGTLNTAQTLTVTRASTSFTHTITATCGTASSTICTKSTTTSISFTPPLAWAAQNTSSTSVSVNYKIETYNGNTLIGTKNYTVSCAIPASVKPTLSVSTSDPTGYLGTYGAYVQTKSSLKVAITASGSQGSTITNYETTFCGATYSGSTVTISNIPNAGSAVAVSCTVTDSRGRTATYSGSINVSAYIPPNVYGLKVERCTSSGALSSSGAYLKATFSGSVTNLNSKNTATYVIKYKKTSASSYTSATMTSYSNVWTVTNGSYVFAADTSSSYDVQIQVTDKFSSYTITGSGGTTSSVLSILARGTGLAIGKIAELANYLDVKFKAKFRDTVEMDGAVTMNNGATINGNANVSGTFKATTLNDPYGQSIRNGMTAYATAGLDPNTTLEHSILTDKNTPNGTFMYIVTYFYSSKGTGSNRMQIAYPYNQTGSEYHRYYYSGSWSAWRRHANADETAKAQALGELVYAYGADGGYAVVRGDGYELVRTLKKGEKAQTYSIQLAGAGTTASPYYIHTNSNAGAFGINIWASDKRLKDNIVPVKTIAIDIINRIPHVKFNWINGDPETQIPIGYIADDLQKIYPELVFEVGEEKRKHINSTVLIPLITKAIQEQNLQIENIYNNLVELANEIENLKNK